MRHGIYAKILFLSLFTVCILFLFACPPAYAAKKPNPPKPALSLNLAQGPLGVTLTLTGKNLHPGEASISYVDAQNTPGILTAPSDNKVAISQDGSFVSHNIILSNNGPAGVWNIVVVDSAQTTAMVQYRVLTPASSAPPGVPTLAVNPPTGKIGDVIAFTGNNWLPGGTSVKLLLVTGTATIPLTDTPVKSDKSGAIMGAFHVPSVIAPAQTIANLSAVDASGAMRAQAQLNLVSLVTPTPNVHHAMSMLPAPTPGANNSITIPDILRALSQLNDSSLLLIILLVGGTLGLAGLVLILFMLPLKERPKHTASLPGYMDIPQDVNYTMPKRRLYSYLEKEAVGKEVHGRKI